MLSKKGLTIALIAAAALCAAEGFYLLKYSRPEIRYFQVFRDRPKVAEQSQPTQTAPQDNAKTEPEWLKGHPILNFLGTDHDVVTKSDDYKGPLFALRKPTGDSGDYQLWKIDGYGREELLTGGVVGYCDDITLDIVSTQSGQAGDYAILSNMNSPCEAGASYKDLYYDIKEGTLAFETSYYTSGDAAINPKPGDENSKIKIVPVFTGSCKVADQYLDNPEAAPVIKFTGINVTAGKNKKFFPLTKEQNTKCEMVYGGGFDYPGFNSAKIVDDKAVLGSVFGVSITLDPLHPFTNPTFTAQ